MSKIIKVKASETGNSGDIHVSLQDDSIDSVQLHSNDLGRVQSIEWKAKVGELSSCKIETIMTPAELEIALKNTELKIVLDHTTHCKLCYYLTYFSKERRETRKLFKNWKKE